jgi:hypothetical protein
MGAGMGRDGVTERNGEESQAIFDRRRRSEPDEERS